ncbi:MAG TPA: hypothetical protein VI298_02850 [Geobacteraceae bacterium]
MKFTAALVFAALLLPGHVLAASGYDTCVQEEQTLRAQEKDRCSGLRYILNPSGCFAAQKALKAHREGKCRDIIRAGETKAAPIPPAAPPPVSAPARPAPASPRTTDAAKEQGTGAEQECDRLKAENARLRAEIERLRAEIDQLGKRQK